jgi:hypothetical protein
MKLSLLLLALLVGTAHATGESLRHDGFRHRRCVAACGPAGLASCCVGSCQHVACREGLVRAWLGPCMVVLSPLVTY